MVYHSGPSGVTPNKGYRPQFWKRAYISKVNRARKVKSDAHQVATNKNSDPVQKNYLGVFREDSAPNSIFSNFWNCPKRVELESYYLGCRLI